MLWIVFSVLFDKQYFGMTIALGRGQWRLKFPKKKIRRRIWKFGIKKKNMTLRWPRPKAMVLPKYSTLLSLVDKYQSPGMWFIASNVNVQQLLCNFRHSVTEHYSISINSANGWRSNRWQQSPSLKSVFLITVCLQRKCTAVKLVVVDLWELKGQILAIKNVSWWRKYCKWSQLHETNLKTKIQTKLKQDVLHNTIHSFL